MKFSFAFYRLAALVGLFILSGTGFAVGQDQFVDGPGYRIRVNPDGFRWSVEDLQGGVIAAPHSAAGVTVNGSPALTASRSESNSRLFHFNTATAGTGTITFECEPNHIRVRVYVSTFAGQVALRLAPLQPAYGLGDIGGYSNSFNLAGQFTSPRIITNDGGKSRWTSSFMIFPAQGFAGALMRDVDGLVTHNASTYALINRERRDLVFDYFVGNPKEIYAAFKRVRNEAGYHDPMPAFRLFELGWESWDALRWDTNAGTVKSILEDFLADGYPIRWAVTGSGFWEDGHTTTSFGRWHPEKYPDPVAFKTWLNDNNISWMIGQRTNFIALGGPYVESGTTDNNRPLMTFETGPHSQEGINNGFFITNSQGVLLERASGVFPKAPCYLLDGHVSGAAEWFADLWELWGVDGVKEDTMIGPPNSRMRIFNTPMAELSDRGYLVMARNGYLSSPGTLTRINDTHIGEISGRMPINFLQYAASGAPNVYADPVGFGGFNTDRIGTMRMAWMTSLVAGMSLSTAPTSWLESERANLKKACDFHYAIAPYLYSAAMDTARTGYPYTLTPLPIAFPNDPETYELATNHLSRRQYQWMAGESILATPFARADYRTNNRMNIYLPAGRWADYETGTIYEGPTTLTNFEMPLNKIPCFVGGKGILVLRDSDEAPLRAVVYPVAPPNSSYNFTFPDGTSKSTIHSSFTTWNTATMRVIDLTTGRVITPDVLSPQNALSFPISPQSTYTIVDSTNAASVANAGFESGDSSGWVTAPGTVSIVTAGGSSFPQISEGTNAVVVSNGPGRLYQLTGERLAAGATYNLQVSVGQALGAGGFGGYKIELLAASDSADAEENFTLLASSTTPGVVPNPGDWAVVSTRFTAPASGSLIGQHLVIRLTSTASAPQQTAFDNILLSREFTQPEASVLPVIDRIPAQSWVNVKTDVNPPAVGDGVADDTAAIQAGLDLLRGGTEVSNSTVLYLPPGNYRITDSLVMSKAFRRPGNRMVGHGAATRIVWDGTSVDIGDGNPSQLNTLRANPAFSSTPDEREIRNAGFISAPEKRGDRYGERLSGWLLAPQTGNYTFHIAGDNECELRVSTSAEPGGAVLVSRVPGWTLKDEWGKYPQQTSAPVSLQAGQLYFFEVLHKENTGEAHVAIGWSLPDGSSELPIPATRARVLPQADAAQGYTYEFWRDPVRKLSRMFISGGASESSYSGIVFDGNGKALVGVNEMGEFKTMMTYEYCAFINCIEAGVMMGPQNPNATAETEYLHCVFENNGTGLAIHDFNYYNVVVDACLFRNNGTGVATSRYGQIYARNSRFEHSGIRDFHLGASHKHAIRRCVSVGSPIFIEGSHFTVQDCLVTDWTNPGGAIIIGGGSPPVLIFDTTFENPPSSSAPIIAGGTVPVLLSNINSPGTSSVFQGVNRLDIPPGNRGGTVSVEGLQLDFSPPPAPTRLFDARQEFAGNVQATINAARAYGKGAVAYFPAGGYSIPATIEVGGADYTIQGDGYNTEFRWTGAPGGTVMHIEDPQNLRLDNFMIVTHNQVPRDLLCIRQTSTGQPSSITYNRVIAGVHGEMYRTDDAKDVRGIHFVNLGAGSRVHMNMVSASVAFTNCSAAEILMRFQYGGPIIVENPAGAPRTGFLGGLNVNHVDELVVRDSSDIVFTEFYQEQGNDGLIQLHGKPEDPDGQVTLGATRLHQWSGSPYFARIDGYRGQLTYAHADVNFDNSPAAYKIEQPSASPFTLLMFGHNRFTFDLQLDPSTKRVFASNLGSANVLPEGGLDALAAALDHWRLLGSKDREFTKASQPGELPGEVPLAPSGLSVTATSSSQINLTWNDNSNNEFGFKIERKTGSSGSWSQIATVGVGVTTYSNTGLSASTPYFYRVRAFNSTGDSVYSNQSSATTPSAITLPTAPSGLSATASSSTQINLTWNNNSSNETEFKIERKTGSGGSWSQIAIVGAGVTTYSSTGLSASTSYFYRVRASNSAGDSAYSNEANATTQSGTSIPTAPSGLSATATSSSQINLTWNDNSNNETGFKIERKTGSGGSWSQIATVGAGVTTYSSTGLSASTSYVYRVRASNSAGDSAYSNEASATTQSAGPDAQAHPVVPGDSVSSQYTVRVGNADVPVVDRFGPFSYAHCSLLRNGEINVQVSISQPITSHTIRALSGSLSGTVSGNVLSFTIDRPQYVAVKINSLDTLFLFCDPAESAPVAPGDANVINLGSYGVDITGAVVETTKIQQAIADVSQQPGKSILYFPAGHYRAGTLRLLDGVTLYLAEGALLQASDNPLHFDREHPGGHYRQLNFIIAKDANNIGIRGRGVIDGNAQVLRPLLSGLPALQVVGRGGAVDANRIVNVQFSGCENVRVEGVLSRNSSGWNTVPHYCAGVDIENYKVLSDMIYQPYKNEPAVTPDSCLRLRIENSFFLSRDDGIALKIGGIFNGANISPDGRSRNMQDVLVRKNLIWSESAAMKIGSDESEAGEISRVTFEENAVLSGRDGVQIETSGPTLVHHVTFRRNVYGSISDRNYWLNDVDANNLRFINEKHSNAASVANVVKSSNVIFDTLAIAGVGIDTAARGNFSVTGTNVVFSGVGRAWIVDNNTTGTFSSNYRDYSGWSTGAGYASTRYGANYRFINTGGSIVSPGAVWNFPGTEATECDLFMWWPSDSNASGLIPLSVIHQGGVDNSKTVNQKQGGGQWNLIGRYVFRSGDSVTLISSDSLLKFADAVRFVEVAASSTYPERPTPPPSTSVATLEFEPVEVVLPNIGSYGAPAVAGYSGGSVSNLVNETIHFTPDDGFTSRARFDLLVGNNFESAWSQVHVEVLARTLANWRAVRFPTSTLADPTKEATIWGDEADADGDGRNTLLEYYFDTDPMTSDQAPISLQLAPSQQEFVLEYTRARALRSVTFAYIGGPDLRAPVEIFGGEEELTPDGPLEHVRFTLPEVTSDAFFLRIQVKRQ